MSKKQFTPEAELLWTSVPSGAKEKILKNVFCVKCRVSIPIVDYTGREKNGNVLLEGKCGVCGHSVARVGETSEVSFDKN